MVDITIVMPAYNVDKYIRKSIQSVLSQSFEDWELLVVNDGSTDNTRTIIEEFVEKDSRIKLFNQENGGVSSARNKGLALASGKYISFLDSDDMYDEHYMELMVKHLINNEADMTFCRFQELDGERVLQESSRDISQLYNNNFIDHIMNVKNANHSMGTMYRLEVIKKHNIFFNEKYSYGEDLEFLLTASYFSRIAFVPYYLYKYIFRGGSLSRRDIPYKDLLGELDSLYRLNELFVGELRSIKSTTYDKYIEKRKHGVLNNLRRYYWSLLKQKKYDQLAESLEKYQVHYGEKFNVKYLGLKRITNSYKLNILRSHSKILWKISSNLPF